MTKAKKPTKELKKPKKDKVEKQTTFNTDSLDVLVKYGQIENVNAKEKKGIGATNGFSIRTSKPRNNKYYMRKANGGYSLAIQGYPTDPYANVLANCVGYANSRFAEIIGKNKIEYQLVCNAENFIERAKALGLKISSKPTLGGIMVWQLGSLSSNDGVGHVAIVERIDNDKQIFTSESSYGGAAFFNATRKNTNGRWGFGAGYTFRGCIVNPAVNTTVKPTKPTTSSKTLEQLAQEVLNGKWGNGTDRKARLDKAYKNGEIKFTYTQVQNKVNELVNKKSAIKVGNTVTVIKPVIYGTTTKFKLYYKKYKVMELKGNRAVIGVNGVVVAAINISNLKKA